MEFYSIYKASESIAIIWSDNDVQPVINRVLLSFTKTKEEEKLARYYPNAKPSSNKAINRIFNQIHDYLKGKDIRFSLSAVRLGLCPAFQQKVLRANYNIPRGRISAYGLIAKKIGYPQAARAVGTALANNPFPIIIPCHRVIRSDGTLGGFTGGLRLKQRLLKLERIEFYNKNRVKIRDFLVV